MSKSNAQQAVGTDSQPRPDQAAPQPPPFQRKLRIAPLQLIGVPLLALLPVLALFGVFGEGSATAYSENGEIALQVDYTSIHRYQMRNAISVAVTNLSQQSPATITVAIDREYLEHFTAIHFVPEVARITADAYEVELRAIESGQTRLLTVEMQGEDYWRRTGEISAVLVGGQPVKVTVATTIFP